MSKLKEQYIRQLIGKFHSCSFANTKKRDQIFGDIGRVGLMALGSSDT